MSLTSIDRLFKFVSPLNVPNFNFLSPHQRQINLPAQSVKQTCPSQTKLCCSYKDWVLGRSWDKLRKERLMMDRCIWHDILICHTENPQDTMLPPLQARSPIINTRAGVAKSSDTNISVEIDGMTICCNLQREREELILNVTVFVVRVWGEGNIERNWYWMLLC